MTSSGYTYCACLSCFDITVSGDMASPDLCLSCADHGCDADGLSDCRRPWEPDEEEDREPHPHEKVKAAMSERLHENTKQFEPIDVVCPNCKKPIGEPCLTGHQALMLGWQFCGARQTAAAIAFYATGSLALIMRAIDDKLEEGGFAAVRKQLEETSVKDTDTRVLMAVIRASFPARDELGEAYTRLLSMTHLKLIERHGKDEAAELMQGLI